MKWFISGSLIGIVIVVGECVLNGVILADQLQASSLPATSEPKNQAALAIFFLLKMYLYGFIIIWFYQSICPKYGEGLKSSLVAGVFFAFLIWVWVMSSMYAAGYVTWEVTLTTMLWGMIEVPVATVLGTTLLDRWNHRANSIHEIGDSPR